MRCSKNWVSPLLILIFLDTAACKCTNSELASRTPLLQPESSSSQKATTPEVIKKALRPSNPSPLSSSTLTKTDAAERAQLISSRPYTLHVPPEASAESPLPLVVFLHGYGASGSQLEDVLEVRSLAIAKGFVAAIPNGTRSPLRRRFWNATPACCNFHQSPVDDVRYLAALIDDVSTQAPIDPERVYLLGFSNGGFMAHRAACELSPRIAAIVSIAGMLFFDEARCRPTDPVAVLQIHGDIDDIVPYDGGRVLGRSDIPPHPSARETVERWAKHNGCHQQGVVLEPIDLEPRISGPETLVTRFEQCHSGLVELWTVRGGNHFIALHHEAAGRAYSFLAQHRRRIQTTSE